MTKINFNLKHPRVVRAKTQRISLKLATLILYFSFLCFIVALALYLLDEKLCYFIAAMGVPLCMFSLWYRSEVTNVPPVKNKLTPENLLTSELIKYIKKDNLDSVAICEALVKTNSYVFFERRFGLSKDMLIQITQKTEKDWWESTLHLYEIMPDPDGVDSAHVILAIILNSDQKISILTALKTSEKDMLSGLSWILHWKELQRELRTRKSGVGIARDWATGYTPMLDRFGLNISHAIKYGGSYHRDIFGHKELLHQISSALTQEGRSNILLVGETGVGKTTSVEAFADYLLFNASTNYPLRFHKIYKINTAAMLTQLNSQNLLENALYSMAVEAKKAKNIILFFPDVANLFGIEGGIDIGDTMLPILQNGSVRIIFSATEGQWKWLQQQKPQLSMLLNLQFVQPPSSDDCMRILENQAIFMEHQYQCLFTYNGLKEVYSMASRYGPDVAMPASAISVMETVARINAGTTITDQSVAYAIEQTTGIKVGKANAQEKTRLLELESILHEKVIGQKQAIDDIVRALKRSRTGISSQQKPIGTFLFLGPTGVGKTETAKAVAEAYFNGVEKLIRVDMNEYTTSESLERFLESGATRSSSLLDQIRKQPFSVVLLDEIEKAHQDVINSLLQMLDEGIMRDLNNKPVSFRDAIIIATSNAGAQKITEEIMKSSNYEIPEKVFTQQLIESGIFRPELINRFDSIVIYKPLTESELEQVVDVQIKILNSTIANQQISVSLTAECRTWLAKNGYDPLMGARPIKRLIQRTVEDALSKKILEDSALVGSGVNIVFDVSDLSVN